MWSEGITGRQGPVCETYHRLGVYMSVDDFNRDKGTSVKHLVKEGALCTITITISRTRDVDAGDVVKSMREVSSWANNPLKKVTFILTLAEYNDGDIEWLRTFRDCNELICVSFSYQSSRERTVDVLLAINEVVLSFTGACKIGLENYPEEELQWIVEHSNNIISILNFGVHTSPNLRMRQLDFGYSRLCNGVVYFDTASSTDGRYDYIRTLSEKYGHPPATVLAKALLQLGVIVMFSLSCGVPFLSESVLPICHPFTYRHEQLAPQQPKTFIVSDADIQFIIAASEVKESAQDEITMYSNAPVKRELEFPKLFGEK